MRCPSMILHISGRRGYRARALFAGVFSILMFCSSAQASETIQRIKNEGTLRACMAASAPFALRDPATGQWSGFEVEMAKDLAATLGVPLNLVEVTFATMIPALLGGKCDIIMAPTQATAARAEVVAFSAPYNSTGHQIVIRQDAQITSLEQLNDPKWTIAVGAGTQEENDAKRKWPSATVKPIISDNSSTVFLEVSAGRADAAFASKELDKSYIEQNPQSKLKILEPEKLLDPVGRAYAVRTDDWHFLNFLNVWLATAKLKYSSQ